MIIGIDGRVLQGNLTGIGYYTCNFIKILEKELPRVKIIIYTNRRLDLDFSSSKIIIKVDANFDKLKPMLWSKFFLARLCNKDKVTHFIAGGTFLPLFLSIKTLKISIVYDLNHLLFPETMAKGHLLTYKTFFKADIFKADILVAISQGTSDKLLQYYNRKTDCVVYPPISNIFQQLSNEEVKEVLTKIGLVFPYLLAVATQEPRKNLIMTINAFNSLKKEGVLDYSWKLVLVGKKGWKSKELDSLIEASDDIVQFGYVDERLLPFIYFGCKLFLFPSSYEGFGMPPLEAMLCGKKIVASDITEIREATFNQGEYFDVNDEISYQKLIESVLLNDSPIDVSITEKYFKLINSQISNFVKLIS